MQGKIIKGIAGFYYVDVAESGIYIAADGSVGQATWEKLF